MMAPAGWEGSPGRLAFLRNRALRDKEGDGGDGDEKKKRANVWWCGDLFVSLRRRLQPKTAATETKGAGIDGR